jgi:hypothetical protein
MTKMVPTQRRARCNAVLTPMTPPPMIVTEACEGSGSGGPGSSTEVLPRCDHREMALYAEAADNR